MTQPARGEIWWGETPDSKGRPFLVLTRDVAVPVLRTLLVAPVTRTIRGIPSELPLGNEEGLPAESVATMDGVLPFPKALLIRRMGNLTPGKLTQLCESLRAAVDC